MAMIRIKDQIPPAELIQLLRDIRSGNNALPHIYTLLLDMGLIDSKPTEYGFVQDYLTEAGRKLAEGQVEP